MSNSVGQPAASSNNHGQGDQPSLLLSVHPGGEKAPEYPERVEMDEDEPTHTESDAKERAAGARTTVKAPTIAGRVREEVEAVADVVQGGNN
ncbi:unnamed protein product [Closterium sp. Yama58-4]|nr:unnamed protein product [Closterium sp. Yama58-4]